MDTPQNANLSNRDVPSLAAEYWRAQLDAAMRERDLVIDTAGHGLDWTNIFGLGKSKPSTFGVDLVSFLQSGRADDVKWNQFYEWNRCLSVDVPKIYYFDSWTGIDETFALVSNKIFDARNWWNGKAFSSLGIWLIESDRQITSDEHDEEYRSVGRVLEKLESLTRKDRLSIWRTVVRDLLFAPHSNSSDESIKQRVGNVLRRLLANELTKENHPNHEPSLNWSRMVRDQILSFELLTGVSPPEMTAYRPPSKMQSQSYGVTHYAEICRPPRASPLYDGQGEGHPGHRCTSCDVRNGSVR